MKKRAVVLGVLAWSALACGFDESPTGHAVCVEGQSAECACEDGARGLHTCSRGEYGACSCGPGSGASTGDPASDADDQDGTSSNAAGAGSGSTAGTEPTGGEAGASSVPGSVPSAGSGSSGASGAGVVGGSGEAGKAGAGDAGGAGEAGSMGSEAGSGGDDEELPPAEPGTPYGACAAQGDCEGGLLCYTLNANGAMTGYCAPACTFDGSGNGSGGLGSCKQQPESGEVQAQCATLLGVCLLATCEGQTCPSGMECIETAFAVPAQQSGFYDCRYPASP